MEPVVRPLQPSPAGDLEPFRIGSIDDCYYLPEYVTEAEAERLQREASGSLALPADSLAKAPLSFSVIIHSFSLPDLCLEGPVGHAENAEAAELGRNGRAARNTFNSSTWVSGPAPYLYSRKTGRPDASAAEPRTYQRVPAESGEKR